MSDGTHNAGVSNAREKLYRDTFAHKRDQISQGNAEGINSEASTPLLRSSFLNLPDILSRNLQRYHKTLWCCDAVSQITQKCLSLPLFHHQTPLETQTDHFNDVLWFADFLTLNAAAFLFGVKNLLQMSSKWCKTLFLSPYRRTY